jgi:ABC-type branched-subunit amino acid transport system ATPase component/ABC-type branched-subunit amino acid transport system permease subunit
VAGLDTVVIVVLLVVLVLVRVRGRADDFGSWSLTGTPRARSEDIARLPVARWVPRAGVGLLLVGATVVPLLTDTATRQNSFARVLVILIVTLSATVLLGWAGQVSLGQFAFVGVGAYATAYYAETLPYAVAVAIGTAWGVLIAVIVGVPTLRIHGLYFAAVTLGFQLAANAWLFPRESLNNAVGGAQAQLDHATVGGWDLLTDKRAYYYVCLGAVVIVLFLVTRLRRSGVGRSLIAVRDNEESAAAFTLSPTRARLVAVTVSGGIAAFAGGLYAASFRQFSTIFFAPEESLRIVAISVVGGVTSIVGAVLGTIVVAGLPTVFESSPEVRLLSSGVGMLVLLMYLPGGLVSIVHNVRDQLYDWIARHAGVASRSAAARVSVAARSARASAADGEIAPLVTRDVTVRFEGRLAVDHVSITLGPGEIVGLIGSNGAGKTTLMNAVCGLVAADGHVEVFGHTVDHLAAHRRARLGIGRTFQSPRLFATLTVRETLMTALEATSRSSLVPSMLFLPPSPWQEARKRREADEIITYLGLGRYADHTASELSTGIRRIVELGSLIAFETRVMLLDEPTAGLAQTEAPAFGPLISQIRTALGSSVLLIEHDMRLVMSISQRIYCLEAGAIIAEGTPAAVRNDPRVAASYLGTPTVHPREEAVSSDGADRNDG